jgi:hypothetical protein
VSDVRSLLLNYFREVVLVDTEFRSLGDGRVLVRCVCAFELRSGREHRLWVKGRARCPYPIDRETLFVAHYASAEIASHHSLGWPAPANVLDTCVEFSALTSGLRGRDQHRTLLGDLKWFHIDSLTVEAKQGMRDLAVEDRQNEDYRPAERRALLDYCWGDVEALRKLLSKLEPCLCDLET